MGFSLWLEQPAVQTLTRNGHSVTIYHQAAASMEARIWLAAAADAFLLVLIGAVANLYRRGIYVSAAGAIVLALATVHRLDHWTALHSLRYPLGMDLIRESSTSNTLEQGPVGGHGARHLAELRALDDRARARRDRDLLAARAAPPAREADAAAAGRDDTATPRDGTLGR